MNHFYFNQLAQNIFDFSGTEDFPPIDEYPIRKKPDPFGRSYFGVCHFCDMDIHIEKDCDLSWLEWDGNEVYLSGNDKEALFRKAIGIFKSWQAQLQSQFPEDQFAMLASFDDGSLLFEPESESDHQSDLHQSFTLRFWKIREGQGPDERMDSDQPVITWVSD